MAREFSKSFYDSIAWKKVREYCMIRDHYSCVDCGYIAEEVHHIIWLTKNNIDDVTVTLNPDNLISLCHDCHMKRHAKNNIDYDFEFDSNGQLIRKKTTAPINS